MAKEHCLAALCKAERASPGMGPFSMAWMMLDKSVEQKVLEEKLTFETHNVHAK